MWKALCCLVFVGCFAGPFGSTRDKLADRCGDAAHDCAVCVFTGTPREECRICATYDDFCKDRAEAQEKDQVVQSLGLKSWPKTKDEETKAESQTETKAEPQTETNEATTTTTEE